MKAMLWTAYGSPEVLQLREIDQPTPKKNEVLIKIHATTVTAGDCEMRALKFPFVMRQMLKLIFGITKPKRLTLGQEIAGTIEAIGSAVTKFNVGDKVFAASMMQLGSYAEFICLPEKYPIFPLPNNMSFEEAATIPTGGVNGLHFLKKGEASQGDHVLINGAGGSIGTYAIQIAKSYGAVVTAVDSASKLEMLLEIGADHVIDFEQEDFTQHGKTYDVIVDIVGLSNYKACIHSLKPKGRYVLGNPNFGGMMRSMVTGMTSDKKVLFELAAYKPEDIRSLVDLIESEKVKSIIDKRYPLSEIVEAHRYVESGKKKGNLVINVC